MNTKEELQKIANGNFTPKKKGKVVPQETIDKEAEKIQKRQIKRGIGGPPASKDRTVNRMFSHKQPEPNSKEARLRELKESRLR
jgi:hypothetical protein